MLLQPNEMVNSNALDLEGIENNQLDRIEGLRLGVWPAPNHVSMSQVVARPYPVM